MTISAFSNELAQVWTKKKEFLDQIERIVPWKEWLAMIQPCYYKGERGNKPYPLETMLRLYLLQNLYDLSDEATVAEAIKSRAFSEFCGVDSSNQVPDGNTGTGHVAGDAQFDRRRGVLDHHRRRTPYSSQLRCDCGTDEGLGTDDGIEFVHIMKDTTVEYWKRSGS